MQYMLSRLLCFIISCALLGSCGSGEKEVVIYTSVDQVFAEPILKDLERETGIKVKAVFDTEETKSTGVLNRIIAEAGNPQCDVFWSGDPVRANVLKQKDISAAYSSPNAVSIPAYFVDPQKHWTGFSARARVLLYNKQLLPESKAPRSLFDLTKPAYKGQVAIANPLFGTTSFHVAAIFSVLGNAKAREWLEDLKANQVVIAASNGDVKKRVATGQVWCGLTDTDDANEAIKEGSPVGVIFLGQQDIGSLIVPNTVSLLKNSPNPENGRKAIDYLISPQTQQKLARSCAQMPLSRGVAVPRGVFSLEKVKPMQVDYDKTSRKLQEIQPLLQAWVNQPG
jgi:iron(III) transport system substrate-binding protein